MKTAREEALILLYTPPRDAPPVEAQPAAYLKSWRLVQVQDDSVRLVGVTDGNTYRLTSPVIHIDVTCRVVSTSSGRQYQLVGPPAITQQERTLIAGRIALNGLVVSDDASEALWSRMLACTQ